MSLRVPAFTDREVTNQAPAAAPVFEFPIPELGPVPPRRLAFQTLMKAGIQVGLFIIVVRLITMAHHDAALFLVRALAAGFSIALVIRAVSSDGEAAQWPIWVGGGMFLLFGASQLVPGLWEKIFGAGDGTIRTLIPTLLEIGILGLVVMAYLSPSVRNLTQKRTRTNLRLCLLASAVGGQIAVVAYVPESSFGAWNFFIFPLLCVCVVNGFICDQYLRFQRAMNGRPDVEAKKDELKKWIERYLISANPLSFPKLLAGFWIGNLVFLGLLHVPFAPLIGLVAAILSVLMLSLVTCPKKGMVSMASTSWDAITFWLTYNRQGVSKNPNVFQCRLPFQDASVRLGACGFAVLLLGLGLLHLLGVCASPGSNPRRLSAGGALMHRMLPQSQPAALLESGFFDGKDDARIIFEKHRQQIETEGDAAFQSNSEIRSIPGLLIRIVLAIVLAPMLFVLLFVAAEGNHLARIIQKETSAP